MAPPLLAATSSLASITMDPRMPDRLPQLTANSPIPKAQTIRAVMIGSIQRKPTRVQVWRTGERIRRIVSQLLRDHPLARSRWLEGKGRPMIS